MPHQVFAARLSFEPVDENGLPTGAPEIKHRGEMVPDYVSEFLISSLTSAGMIIAVHAARPDVVPADAIPVQVRTPDQPPMLPSDPAGSPDPAGRLLGKPPTGSPVADSPVVEPAVKPKTTDRKEAWEAYAPTVGIETADAEAMTKVELIAEVQRREIGDELSQL